jgi:hypothetical protein
VGRLGLLKEIKVGLVHLEVSIFSLTNELVVFADLAHLLIVLFELFRVLVGQNFEFALKLPLLDFMQAFLVVLVAQIVDRHLPSLKEMSSPVRDLLSHAGQVTSVVL